MQVPSACGTTSLRRVARLVALALSGLLLLGSSGCKVVLASGDADPAQTAPSQHVAEAPR